MVDVPAGPELDALVARTVLGCNSVVKKGTYRDGQEWEYAYCECPGWKDGFAPKEHLDRDAETLRCDFHVTGDAEELASFSSDIDAAWRIVSKALDYVAATTDANWKEFGGDDKPTRHKWELWFGERGEGRALYGKGFGDTAPLAICRAALDAFGL